MNTEETEAKTEAENEAGNEVESEAVGTFEVKLAPIGAKGDPIATLSIRKAFHGDLEGSSVGQMLAFRSALQGSAGYVALERVTATLAQKQGGFTLQHTGLMDKGAPSLTVIVVPDSGTDGLSGLAGSMHIAVAEGKHHYRLSYTLPM